MPEHDDGMQGREGDEEKLPFLSRLSSQMRGYW